MSCIVFLLSAFSSVFVFLQPLFLVLYIFSFNHLLIFSLPSIYSNELNHISCSYVLVARRTSNSTVHLLHHLVCELSLHLFHSSLSSSCLHICHVFLLHSLSTRNQRFLSRFNRSEFRILSIACLHFRYVQWSVQISTDNIFIRLSNQHPPLISSSCFRTIAMMTSSGTSSISDSFS